LAEMTISESEHIQFRTAVTVHCCDSHQCTCLICVPAAQRQSKYHLRSSFSNQLAVLTPLLSTDETSGISKTYLYRTVSYRSRTHRLSPLYPHPRSRPFGPRFYRSQHLTHYRVGNRINDSFQT